MNDILEYGKIPPQAIDLEEAVLGAIMLEKNAIIEVYEKLKPSIFYKEENSFIYESIMSLYENNKGIDILTVTEELRKCKNLDRAGGALYVTQLTDKIVSAAHIRIHAEILTQKYMQREYIRVASELINISYDDSLNIKEITDFAESEILNISNIKASYEAEHIKPIMLRSLEEIEIAYKSDSKLIGISSGLKLLDRITNGWQKTDLIIIAARPSMGKTAFMLKFAKESALQNSPVAVFSLEMNKTQLINRLISSETDISPTTLRSGNFTDDKWIKIELSVSKLDKLPFYIDDKPAITINQFKSRLRKYKHLYNIEIAFIDYLQLMSGSGKNKVNREQEISEISRGCKEIAKELNIPVIALSQLNRAVEMRSGDKRPQLSDLRESGAIEQDADMVAFIHRPEKYGFLEDNEGNSLIGISEIIISKHRNGPIGTVSVHNNKSLTKITDIYKDENNNIHPDKFIESSNVF